MVRIVDDLDKLLEVLPPRVRTRIEEKYADRLHSLIEIVLDFGRPPEVRFSNHLADYVYEDEVTLEDINYVVKRIGEFTGDNRAGIERTLHRISAIRNRKGKIIGLTLRVGRAVYGTIDIIRDIVASGKNILLLGKPGVGKTTMLREAARVLADDLGKRVIIVDTSNEIGGDGDIPHPGIGKARRMQVPEPELQYKVMIEAVENHMPEVIVIDEIGNELEAKAARTIAERGVQLIATAHGYSLENLLMNPTLCDLVGGIQAVTLSDEEAKRRGTQKTILERKAPPTFDVVVEIRDFDTVAIHRDVATVVDQILRGAIPKPEIRKRTDEGFVVLQQESVIQFKTPPKSQLKRIYPYGITRDRLEDAILSLGLPAKITKEIAAADVFMVLKSQQKQARKLMNYAKEHGVNVIVVKGNSLPHIRRALISIFPEAVRGPLREEVEAEKEIRELADFVVKSGESVEIVPKDENALQLQLQLLSRYRDIEVEEIDNGHTTLLRISPRSR